MSSPGDKRDLLLLPVAAVVLVGWTASLAVGLVLQQYQPLVLTTPLMIALAGYVFGVQIVRKADGG